MTVNDLLIKETDTIRNALIVIDNTGLGICFVADSENKLVGILTDGDIRRLLLRNENIDKEVSFVMQTKYIALPIDSRNDLINEYLSNKIKIIPLIDNNGVPVDFATQNRIRRIPVMEPSLKGNELAYVTECISSGWISSQGKFVKEFERKFAEYVDAKYALSVSNGTVAIHLALAALEIGPGDEVIVPDLTFAATINAVLYTGATPVIIDVNRITWTIDASEVEKYITPKTKAIIPVHLYGHSCKMDDLISIAQKYNLHIVEDCAEALGTKFNSIHVGKFGKVGTFSFFGNKTITTGEGGMLVFDSEKLHEKALVLRDHGMSKQKRYWHEHVGFNYRMTNLQAAIGLAQLEKVESFLNAKDNLAEKYNAAFKRNLTLLIPPHEKWCTHSYWLYTMIINPSSGINRNEFISSLMHSGIEARPVFYPLHEMPPYKKFILKGQAFENTKYISDNGVSLPSYPTISEAELSFIISNVESVLLSKNMVKEFIK